MQITKKTFGRLNEAQVDLFTLANDNHVTIRITNYGAIITSVETPDKGGKCENIVCGFDRFEDYISEQYLGSYPYFGCIIGRFGNRIAKGKFTLEGKEYTLAVNNGPNALHGGLTGFDKKLWKAETIEADDKVGVRLSYTSPDGEEGYPGTLEVTCTYTLNNQNELKIDYEAATDKTTILNLTNHTYFNLTAGRENIMNHELELTAEAITEAEDMIPTGKIVPVEGTAFDFRNKKKLGRDIAGLEHGYDNNYVLGNDEGKLVYAGALSEATTGRSVEVYTTQPGMQLYTGYWNPELVIDGKKKFGSFSGVALETQHYPDSINHKNFPSPILKPGETFKETTIYKL
ncbi:MAG: aldose epimerase family protein [Prolixibacteraceae bacterium]|nr:aldose epimerase family protein [Prolixibacteraceae bacterium]